MKGTEFVVNVRYLSFPFGVSFTPTSKSSMFGRRGHIRVSFLCFHLIFWL